MAEAFWSAAAVPLAAGAALSLLAERLLRPAPRFAARLPGAYAVHMGLWVLLFCLSLALVRRPWFAAVLSVADLFLLAAVSNAKYRALREPFVYQDFEYFSDALKHPRLYLPFFGIGRTLLAFAAFALLFGAGLALETSLLAAAGASAFWSSCVLLAAAGAGLVWAGARSGLPLTLEPSEDLRRLGLLASLWAYAMAERKRLPVDRLSPLSGAALRARADHRANIVVVQNESFFDVRRLYPDVRPDVLREFDRMRSDAVCFGRLEVPVWGANTVRTEFAFLAGIGMAQLEGHQFNPYRRLVGRGFPTIASLLRQAGYRTVCVHPYPASFYRRDRVFPALGFDQFIDIRDFAGAQKDGPFVGDLAVAEKVCSVLSGMGNPALVFVITMENHGPLHLERVAPGDVERLYTKPPPAGFEDLTVFLRHLANADRMIGKLRECLAQSATGGWLCWYGDHVPIMPSVYGARGFADGRTDYFLWQTGGAGANTDPLDLKVEDLGCVLLEKAGLLDALERR